MKDKLFKLTMERPIDIGFQDDDVFRRNRRMVLFDMDR